MPGSLLKNSVPTNVGTGKVRFRQELAPTRNSAG